MIFQQPPPQPSLGDTIIQKIIDVLNYPFINTNQFKVSIWNLLLFLLIITIAFLVSRYLRRFLQNRVLPRLPLDAGIQYTLLRIVHYLIITFGALFAMKTGFSVDLTGVAVILGFLSVGIGFGLQYIAADIVSGFILLFERPVRVGDRLKLDDGVEGRVENISIRSTIIVTNENLAVIVPNSALIQNKLINYSYGSQNVRLNVPVGVAYGSDLETVSKALLEAAQSVEEVLESPPPKVHFSGFGDSSLDFQIRIWINEPHKHPQIASRVNFEIDRCFRKYDIQIPFPQRDLHLRSGFIQGDSERMRDEGCRMYPDFDH
ncbi:MAG: mechanosensitive ion channel, partial [Blastocatellia bacterium]|nr:mechanosensitive ion channel [Blastocatellia bacterium]